MKNIHMGEGSGGGSGRVGSDFSSEIAGWVVSSCCRVESGTRKVTHGQFCHKHTVYSFPEGQTEYTSLPACDDGNSVPQFQGLQRIGSEMQLSLVKDGEMHVV